MTSTARSIKPSSRSTPNETAIRGTTSTWLLRGACPVPSVDQPYGPSRGEPIGGYVVTASGRDLDDDAIAGARIQDGEGHSWPPKASSACLTRRSMTVPWTTHSTELLLIARPQDA